MTWQAAARAALERGTAEAMLGEEAVLLPLPPEDGEENVQENAEEDGARPATVCPVCLDGYSAGQTVARMPCGHRFHGGCIDTWCQDAFLISAPRHSSGVGQIAELCCARRTGWSKHTPVRHAGPPSPRSRSPRRTGEFLSRVVALLP